MPKYAVKEFAKKLVVNGSEVTFTTALPVHTFIETPTMSLPASDAIYTFEEFISWLFTAAAPQVIPGSFAEYWQELVPDGAILYGGEKDTHPRMRFVNANKRLSRVTVQFILTTENVGRWLIKHNFPQMSYAKN